METRGLDGVVGRGGGETQPNFYPTKESRRRKSSGRHAQQRRATRRKLRKFLFLGLLITACLAMGYLISGYEPTVQLPE